MYFSSSGYVDVLFTAAEIRTRTGVVWARLNRYCASSTRLGLYPPFLPHADSQSSQLKATTWGKRGRIGKYMDSK